MSKESKLIINKHYRNASSITEDVFSKSKNYDEENPELFREGEIVISNEKNNPGIFIYTADEEVIAGPNGEVINVTSPEHIHLTSGYTKFTGDTPVIVSGDTIEDVVGKIDKKLERHDNDIVRVETEAQNALQAVVQTNEVFTGVTQELNRQLTAETLNRQERDSELESLITANAESITDLEEATSRENIDTFVTENISGGYNPATREIVLEYQMGDGTERRQLMTVDVTDFTTQIDFLKGAYSYTVTADEGEDFDGVHYNKYDMVLKLVFRVTDSGVQHDEEVWFNITQLIGHHVVLSEEEYDALSEQQKKNGFFYYTYEDED